MMKIIGAGLSGLICGAINSRAELFEAGPERAASHKALLRFRSDAISKSTGIPFRKVTVRKAVWSGSGEITVTPRIANLYSRKVRNVFHANSIWNLEPVTRYIAPQNFVQQLVQICAGRINWEENVTLEQIKEWESMDGIISTIPMPELLRLIGMEVDVTFNYAPIYVSQYEIDDCDLFQTIYYPYDDIDVYRASITGSRLIIESTSHNFGNDDFVAVLESFGLLDAHVRKIITAHEQRYGKIIAIADEKRKAIISGITKNYGIYSLGRFATWRNILLDDVHNDIAAIRKMTTMSHYDYQLERIKK